MNSLKLKDCYFLQIIDIGEDIAVPDDFSEQDMISGMWWRHLVAGGVAGAGGSGRQGQVQLGRAKPWNKSGGIY